ncbi:MAG: hypothetical protein Q8R36_03365 [bacterium]|nr:hypothetical protein [bacterium]
MDTHLKKHLNELAHHAYIIEGNGSDVMPELLSFLEKEHDIVTRGNPDFWCKEFDSFLIDDGHALKRMQTRKGMDGGHKFFVFSFSYITEEAQNTLLKILEEPTEGTHFFIITPSLAQIFPTVLSRAVVIKTNHVSKSLDISNEKIAEEFLRSSPAKRLVLIEKLVEEKKREQATLFLNALEKKLAHNFQKTQDKQKEVLKLKKTALARRDLLTTTPSIKLIFENLALTL